MLAGAVGATTPRASHCDPSAVRAHLVLSARVTGARGGFCCKHGDGCSVCDATGKCTTCSDATVTLLNDGTCNKVRASGKTCQHNQFCSSADCRGGRCCSANAHDSTAKVKVGTADVIPYISCSATGACNACTAGYYLDTVLTQASPMASNPPRQAKVLPRTRQRRLVPHSTHSTRSAHVYPAQRR